MRTILQGTSVAAALVLSAGVALAQNLILNEPTAGTRTIPLAEGTNVQITPDGNIEVSAQANLDCPDGPDDPPGDGPRVSLSASPAAIQPGQSTTISWNISGEFTSCRTSGGAGTSWATLNVNSRSGSEVYSLNQDTSFSMSCTGPGGTDSATRLVDVGTEDPSTPFAIPEGCGGLQPNGTSWAGADDLRTGGNEQFGTFTQAFDNPWPGVSNINRRLGVPRNRFIALRFNASPTLGQSGRINTDIDAFGGREKVVSIAECPGDFRRTLPQGCRVAGVFFNVAWANEDAQGNVPAGHCRLEPGKRYYLNVIFGDRNDPSVNLCPGSECSFLGQLFINQ